MCMRKITDYLFTKKYNITKPVEIEDIDWNELHTLLQAEFPNAQIIITDRKYKVAPLSEYQRFIKWSTIDKREYISDYYDCDDFSISLLGEINIPEWSSLAFGMMFAKIPQGAHAINIFVDNNRNVWIVEPQNDNIFPLPSTWKPYFVLI